MTATSKRSSNGRPYRRRSDDERIEELQSRIAELQAKVQAKKRKDSPVLKEIPKLQKRLRRFAQLALDNGRHDISNTTMAFVAGLERIHATAVKHAALEADDGDD